MCGVMGVQGWPGPATVMKVLSGLRHRGPDGQGVAAVAGGWLGHQRLAIVDPEGGRQPVFGVQRAFAAVVNGEIYNHAALRQRLRPGGPFRGGSDAEVVPRLVETYGLDGLHLLDGMYAGVVACPDGLIGFRDSVGIKPLYVLESGDTTWFASECQALLRAGRGAIHEVPPGHLWLPGDGPRRLQDPEPPAPAGEAPDRAAWLEHYRAVLRRAVTERLMADVPVGALLSGGLDSTIVVALMRERQERVHTFAVGLRGSPDLARARAAAAALGTLHTEDELDPATIARDLPRIVPGLESWDRDLVRSAVPCWYAARLASRQVKVVLTGEGADELFAGYRYLEAWTRPGELRSELERLVSRLPRLNLQRLDRMTMAHGVEGRVPFLARASICTAFTADPRWLAGGPGGIRKQLLRDCFTGVVPADLLARPKAQMDEGAGTSELMPALARGQADLAAERAEAGRCGVRLPRDEEEAWYFRLFRDRVAPARVRAVQGVWDPQPPPAPAGA